MGCVGLLVMEVALANSGVIQLRLLRTGRRAELSIVCSPSRYGDSDTIGIIWKASVGHSTIGVQEFSKHHHRLHAERVRERGRGFVAGAHH